VLRTEIRCRVAICTSHGGPSTCRCSSCSPPPQAYSGPAVQRTRCRQAATCFLDALAGAPAPARPAAVSLAGASVSSATGMTAHLRCARPDSPGTCPGSSPCRRRRPSPVRRGDRARPSVRPASLSTGTSCTVGGVPARLRGLVRAAPRTGAARTRRVISPSLTSIFGRNDTGSTRARSLHRAAVLGYDLSGGHRLEHRSRNSARFPRRGPSFRKRLRRRARHALPTTFVFSNTLPPRPTDYLC